MSRTARQFVLGSLCLLAGFTRSSGLAAEWDVNGDGMIRIAFLSVPQHAGGIDAATVCSDLEAMVKASKPGFPVRVAHEPVLLNRTLMGWWYHPDTQPARAQLLSGQYDIALLAENDDVVRGYPEFFFEGVRAVSAETRSKGARTLLVLMSKPANSFRDKRADAVADIVYRVGDGCGLDVIPAAFGWQVALSRNRMTGDSPVKARACAYLTAAGIYCQLADSKLPKGALETYWTTKKTTEALALSAREAITAEGLKKHYVGPFNGVVRIVPQITKRLKIYVPNTSEEDPLMQNVQFVLDSAFQDWFWKTPGDWYSEGFDRYSAAFDLVYGDMQQMTQYLDETLYTSSDSAPTNSAKPCMVVFCRNPEDDAGGGTLRNLETILTEGYDYAKSRGLVFIPYQIAWARARQNGNMNLAQPAVPGKVNDWLTFMLANMIYTVATDRYQPPPEKPKPHSVNAEHPHGYHEACARIGYETVRQLAALAQPVNAVLLRAETYRIDAATPGFVGIRLLDRPSRETRVFCATDLPGVAELSSDTLVFTPDNFDIEQTIRILPGTNSPTLFFHFMASARSEDKVIDGANDLRPFLLNFNATETASFSTDRDSVSPVTGYRVMLRPGLRPGDMVRARVAQHGRVTEEVYFSPDHFTGSPILLHPTESDYKSGVLPVAVSTESTDPRYNGKTFSFAIRVSADGRHVPRVKITEPADGGVINGPAFVTARAEAEPAQGIRAVSLYLGHKRLGRSTSPACAVAVEQGPPQSRLGGGTYTLWSEATSTGGLSVASEPVTFRIQADADASGMSHD